MTTETHISVFVSYSHLDKETCLRPFLDFVQSSVEEVGASFWWDEKIQTGNPDWDQTIITKIKKADILIALVTQNFLSSEYIKQVEVKLALEGRAKTGMLIYPIIWQTCLWEVVEWLNATQHMPRGQRTIAQEEGENRRAQLKEIAEELRRAVTQLKENREIDFLRSGSKPTVEDTAKQPKHGKQTRRNNLRSQPNRFVGREREIAEIKEALGSTRLVTLKGAPGVGKTRLSEQVAADLLEAFSDGVYIVELAPLHDETLVPQEVASALGVRLESERDAVITLIEYLKTKHLLLVLDNSEHLLKGCRKISVALLNDCPDLRILATSREELNIAFETLCPVDSFPCPDIDEFPSIERVIQYDAVQLFVERAKKRNQNFEVTTQSAALALATICRRVSGIPLAIELAAGWASVFTSEQISSELDKRFLSLLKDGTQPGRWETLREAIGFSYDLLTETERILLRRLSVFVGSWTFDATKVICAGADIQGDEMAHLLRSLESKSLMNSVYHDKEARYQLLEPIREYSHEMLLKSGEHETVHTRHLNYYLNLAEKAEPNLRGEEQAKWFNLLELEHDNLRAALEWSKGNKEASLRLSAALWWFWHIRSYWSEGRMWLERALEYSVEGADLSLKFARAKALTAAGNLAIAQGDRQRGNKFLEEARDIYKKLSVEIETAYAWVLNNLATNQEDYTRVMELLGESLALFRKHNEWRAIALTLDNLGEQARLRGEYSVAKTCYNDALVVHESLVHEDRDKYPLAVANLYHNLGQVALYEADCPLARDYFKKSIAMYQSSDYKRGIIHCIAGLAAVASCIGKLESAARLFGAAEELFRVTSTTPARVDHIQHDQHAASVKAKLGTAAYDMARNIGKKMTLEEAVTYALE